MAILLVLMVAVLLFGNLLPENPGKEAFTEVRKSLLQTLVILAVAAWVYAEGFSGWNAIRPATATGFWSGLLLVMGGITYARFDRFRMRFRALADGLRLERSHRLLLLFTGLLLIVPLFFQAVLVAPNNYDSHHYHLNRLLFWTAYGNLDYFPTQHIQQLYLNVFAEYLTLTCYLLTGSDRLVGIVQFMAFLGSLAGVGLLAKQFGLQRNGQLLATVLMLTLPIGIFESTSTQVDYVACFFFIAYLYFGYELLTRRTGLTLGLFLLSLVLAAFTKYSTLLFAFPFTLYFAIRILRQYGWGYGSKVLILALLFFTGIFAPFCARNYELFGNLLSPPVTSRFFSEKIPVDKYGITYTLSGIVKNSGLHLGLPHNGYNQAMAAGIRKLHEALGVDMDDLALRLDPFSVRFSIQEDMVPNTLHFLLMGLATVVLLGTRGHHRIKVFWGLAIIGFVIFCTLLKFQLWSTRTHMPLFAMGAVAIAYGYCRVSRLPINGLAVPLLLLAAVFVFGNPNKPLLTLPYTTKKILGHIPVAICADTPEQTAAFESALKTYYDFSNPQESCFPVRPGLSRTERLQAFALLDQSGYYDDDKETILTMNRSKAYFLSHPDDYESIFPLIAALKGDSLRIGILFEEQHGFYHFWKVITDETRKPTFMDYIYFKKEFMQLPNARKPFCYDYLLADDLSLIRTLVPAAAIVRIVPSSKHYLVELNARACERYLF